MHKFFFVALLFVASGSLAQTDSGNVVVNKDARVDALVQKQIEINELTTRESAELQTKSWQFQDPGRSRPGRSAVVAVVSIRALCDQGCHRDQINRCAKGRRAQPLIKNPIYAKREYPATGQEICS
jgi:hypothetical protein